MGSPARSEVSSTPGDVEPSASREPEPQMEPDPAVSKPASIEGDDELQALYDNHFKDKPFRLLPRIRRRLAAEQADAPQTNCKE